MSTEQTTQPSDLLARQQAVDPRRSFIVSAPAGSGKTGLITQRLLRLLCTVEHPEEILCITFTRKAAAEMTQRVHQALQNAATQARPDDSYEAQIWDLASQALLHNNSMGWHLLDMPSRLRIQTIDSFCRSIARQFAFETTFAELPEQSEDPDIYYHMAARELIGRLEEDSETAHQLAVLVAHTGNNLSRCEKLLAAMLGKRDQWLPHIYNARGNQGYFRQVIEQLVEEQLCRLHRQLAPLAGELLALADFAGSHAPATHSSLQSLKGIDELPHNSLAGLAQWKCLMQLFVTKTFEPRAQVTAREGFPANKKDHKKRMQELLTAYRNNPSLQASLLDVMHLPELTISASQQPVLDALGLLLPTLVAQLQLIFQQHNQCDYPAITLEAIQALNTSPEQDSISDITLRLDYCLKHILLDEFQDTSGSQIKLLENLIAGWQENDGRTLFLVGDAMQSLYSFRDAKVGLFINAQRHPIGPIRCTALTLSTNFRSQQGIIDWVNSSFKEAFPALPNIGRGAIPYNPSTAHRASESGSAVRFHGICCEQAADYPSAEASQIAELCSHLTAQHKTVAILVRNRSHLRAIVPALKAAKLHWQAIDIDPLATRMPVMDLMSVTRAILSPADRIAWLAVLRAPLCGLSLSDLLAISNGFEHSEQEPDAILHRLRLAQQHPSSIAGLSENGRQILKRIAPILIDSWHRRRRANLREDVEQLWIRLGGPATLIDQSDLLDCRTYLDLLEDRQIAGTLDNWPQFAKAVDNLYAAPVNPSKQSESSRSEGRAQIKIMTIHKAKGLEFDQVILPSLHKTSGADDSPLLRWQEHIDEQNNASLLLATLGPHDENDDCIYRYLKYEQEIKSRLENTRVLYVAATRAISRLYLFAKLKPSKDGWQKPGKNTLLAPVWHSIAPAIAEGCHSVSQLDSRAQHQSEDRQNTTVTSRRLPADFQPQTMPQHMLGFGLENLPAAQPVTDDLDRRARHQGTVLHRTLKQIACEGIDNWPLDRRQKLSVAWTAQLKQLGVIATADELHHLSQAVETMLADAKGQWILSADADSYCEQELAFYDSRSQALGTAIIDRTFVADGIRWIIDYKFSRPASGESQQQFAERQISRYKSKLTQYARLYTDLDSRPIHCALYFPQIALFVPVDTD